MKNFFRSRLLNHDNIQIVRGARGLVLDVGSGPNPFPYANVLCDLYVKNNSQRRGFPLQTKNKPFVTCDAQFLPFRNKAFHLVHCSHVLEHVDNPHQMLKELKRVGKVIHIETPTWLRENIFCHDAFHKWAFRVKGGRIYAQNPKKGITLRLDKFPLFNSFEYLIDEFSHLFKLKVNIQAYDD